MEQKIKVDVYNYFSIELLENMGIEEPNQIQIDKVENSLKKIIKLLNQKYANGAKQQKGFWVQ
ncbi:MAG TPA: hypothetical protein VNK03_02385 [Gammaproteobacteria bacterium]|nr:hypothetical protein [Gammaproteobacteria bacterium]